MNISISHIPVDYRDNAFWKAAVTATTELLKIFSFSDFFHSSASSIARLLRADGAALIVYDGTDRLRYRLFYGMEVVKHEAVANFSFPANEGTVGRVLSTGKYLFTQDYPNSPDAMADFVAAGLKANLVFPVPGPEGFAGAIAVSWITHWPEEPEPAALVIVEMFAALIGSSLHREALEKELKSLSLQDPLTGLANRRMLMVRLADAQKRSYRHQTLLVLAVLDLDGFKRLNDLFGHAEGDKFLVEVAAKLHEAVRTTDMIARIGGDEFVIILEDVHSIREAKAILGRIVESLRVSLEKCGVCAEISASIGAAVYPFDFVDPDSLLVHADEAMYAAKRAGGNRFLLRTNQP